MQLNGGKDKGRNKEQNQCCNQQLPHAWKCDMDVGLNPSPGRLSFWIKVSFQGMKGFSGKILGVMERVWEKMKILFKYGQVEAKLSNPAWDSNQPNVKTSHFLLLFKEMLHSLYPTHTTDTLRKFLENCLEQVTAWQIFFWWLEVSAVLPARLCHVAKHTAVYLPPVGTHEWWADSGCALREALSVLAALKCTGTAANIWIFISRLWMEGQPQKLCCSSFPHTYTLKRLVVDGLCQPAQIALLPYRRCAQKSKGSSAAPSHVLTHLLQSCTDVQWRIVLDVFRMLSHEDKSKSASNEVPKGEIQG